MTTMTASDIANPGLAAEGVRRIEWAAREMLVVAEIRQRFAAARPLEGVRISGCLHVTTGDGQPDARAPRRRGRRAPRRLEPALDAGTRSPRR